MTRGEAMRAARHRAGKTLRQLAHDTGVSHTTIYRLENDIRCGSISTIELLADALGLSIDEYTGHEVERND